MGYAYIIQFQLFENNRLIVQLKLNFYNSWMYDIWNQDSMRSHAEKSSVRRDFRRDVQISSLVLFFHMKLRLSWLH